MQNSEHDATYQRVKNSGALTRKAVAQRCNLPVSEVKFFYGDMPMRLRLQYRSLIFKAIRAAVTATVPSSTHCHFK